MSNRLFDIYADPEQRRHQRRIEYLRWQTADVEQMFHIENRQFRGLVALGTKNLVCVFFISRFGIECSTASGSLATF